MPRLPALPHTVIHVPAPAPKRQRPPRSRPDKYHSLLVWCEEKCREEKAAAAAAAARAAAQAAELDWCIKVAATLQRRASACTDTPWQEACMDYRTPFPAPPQPRLVSTGGWLLAAPRRASQASQPAEAPFAWDPCLLSHPDQVRGLGKVPPGAGRVHRCEAAPSTAPPADPSSPAPPLSPSSQAEPEVATAPNPILTPLKAGPAAAPARPGLATEDVEARQAAAAAEAATRQPRSPLASLRRLGSQLARLASGRARSLRSRLDAAAEPAAVCRGCPSRRLGCGTAAAAGRTSTHVNWATEALAC